MSSSSRDFGQDSREEKQTAEAASNSYILLVQSCSTLKGIPSSPQKQMAEYSDITRSSDSSAAKAVFAKPRDVFNVSTH